MWQKSERKLYAGSESKYLNWKLTAAPIIIKESRSTDASIVDLIGTVRSLALTMYAVP